MDDLYEREGISIKVSLLFPSGESSEQGISSQQGSWMTTPIIYEEDDNDKENTQE